MLDQYTRNCSGWWHLEERFCLGNGISSRLSLGFVLRPCGSDLIACCAGCRVKGSLDFFAGVPPGV